MITHPEKLKYGQTLVDRVGNEYKFLAYEPELKGPYRIAVMNPFKKLALRTAKGYLFNNAAMSELDLSLPKKQIVKTVWFVKNLHARTGHYVTLDEKIAQEAIDRGDVVTKTMVQFEEEEV